MVAVFAGAAFGLAREIHQNWGDLPEDNDGVDSSFDALAMVIGAFGAALVWEFSL
jgi:hypothetical protein